MAKTPRGGAIALPIPTNQDVDRSTWRTEEECGAFQDALAKIPNWDRILESVEHTLGRNGVQGVLVVLSILNETELRENRRHDLKGE